MADHDPLNPARSRADADREALVGQSQHAGDIQRLMSEPWGRRLVWTWLEFMGVYRLSFTGEASRTDFNEGTRNCGLMLLASVMEHAPEAWPVMHAEAKRAAAERKVVKENQQSSKRRRRPL